MLLKSIKFLEDYHLELVRKEQRKKFPTQTIKRKHRIHKKKLDIRKYFFPFTKDFEIQFDSLITVIVGENGSGKSLLFKILNSYFSRREKPTYFACDFEDGVSGDSIIHYNAMEHTPKNMKIYENDPDFIRKSVYLWDVGTYSSGEIVLDFLDHLLESKIENRLLLLDEPETSLSLKNQVSYYKKLCKLSKSNQIIIITHSYPIIHSTETVYDMSARKYLSSKEFLENSGLKS